MLYTHAAMALWGTNTYIMFTVGTYAHQRLRLHCVCPRQDVDEFLRVPQGVTVQQLLAPGGCLHGLVYAQLSRYNYDCKCVHWRDMYTQTMFFSSPVLLHCLSPHRCGRVGGLDWVSEHGGVRHADMSVDYFRKCVHREPQWKEWGKTLAWADALSYQQAHDGYVYPEYLPRANGSVDYGCVSVVHLHGLFSQRAHDTVWEEDAVWLWPFLKRSI